MFEFLRVIQSKLAKNSIKSDYCVYLGNSHYQLDVDIAMIKFTHHPLFSKEHVLESKLLQLFNHYVSRQKSGLKDHLSTKVIENTSLLFSGIGFYLKWRFFVIH